MKPPVRTVPAGNPSAPARSQTVPREPISPTDPAVELEHLREDADALLEDLRARFDWLLQAADARVRGRPVPLKWREFECALGTFGASSVTALTDQITRFMDAREERLLRLLAPLEGEAVIWSVPLVVDGPPGNEDLIDFLVCVTSGRAWVIRNPWDEDRPPKKPASGTALRFVLAEWLDRPAEDETVLFLEGEALARAEALARRCAASPY